MAHGTPDWAPLATASGAELPTYRFPYVAAVLAGQSGLWLFTVFNPANSGMLAKLRRVRFSIAVFPNQEGILLGNIDLYRITASGTGDLLTVSKHDSHDPASALVPRVNFTVNPTAENRIDSLDFSLERTIALQPSRAAFNNYEFDIYEHSAAGQAKPVFIRPGEGFGLFQVNSTVLAYVAVAPAWTEEISS